MFSVVALTLNEEANLPACLDSLGGASDDVWVIDSGSTDRTVEIAGERGAHVLTRAFDDFGAQRNFAHEAAAFRHPWVFHLDADERMTPELAAECNALPVEVAYDAFLVPAKWLFFGRWLPRSTNFPVYQTRFVRAKGTPFVRAGHGQREAPGQRLGKLREAYLHELMSDGVEAWLAKHRRYARAEAAEMLQHAAGGRRDLRDVFSSDRTRRRRALKQFATHLPARAALRFFYQYVICGGFLEGGPGLQYCRLISRYEGFVAEELRRALAQGGAPLP